METLLNLIWLAITVAAVWVWRFRWSGSRIEAKHNKKIQSVAMVCVLAILFPVISLTDDLHPEIVVVDAASGKRNACLIAASAPQLLPAPAAASAHFAVAILISPLVANNFLVSRIVPLVPFHPSSVFASSSPGRSPPVLS
jgi:hypothetical protein